jgi:transcription antitermination protein NusB
MATASSKPQANKRGTARLHAVQAIYQMEIAKTPINEVIASFTTFFMGKEVEGMEFLPSDELYFKNIIQGVLREQGRLDPAINDVLEKSWPLKRIDMVMRSIFRAGAFELFGKLEIPAKVIIAEYVDVAHAFLEADECGMVNAVLDELAKRVRKDEFI